MFNDVSRGVKTSLSLEAEAMPFLGGEEDEMFMPPSSGHLQNFLSSKGLNPSSYWLSFSNEVGF